MVWRAGGSSILLPEKSLFQLFLFPRLSVADSRCKIRSWKWHFPPAFWAGRQEGRWSNCTMTDYANPPRASNQSRLWERNAAHLQISLRRHVLAWSIPPQLEWHQSSSESLKVWGLISWRNWPLLPITTLQSRPDTLVDMREREADYCKQEAQRQHQQ